MSSFNDSPGLDVTTGASNVMWPIKSWVTATIAAKIKKIHIYFLRRHHKRVEELLMNVRQAAFIEDPIEPDHDRELYEDDQNARKRVNAMLFIHPEHLRDLLLLVIFIFLFDLFEGGGDLFKGKLRARRLSREREEEYFYHNGQEDDGEPDTSARQDVDKKNKRVVERCVYQHGEDGPEHRSIVMQFWFCSNSRAGGFFCIIDVFLYAFEAWFFALHAHRCHYACFF